MFRERSRGLIKISRNKSVYTSEIISTTIIGASCQGAINLRKFRSPRFWPSAVLNCKPNKAVSEIILGKGRSNLLLFPYYIWKASHFSSLFVPRMEAFCSFQNAYNRWTDKVDLEHSLKANSHTHLTIVQIFSLLVVKIIQKNPT